MNSLDALIRDGLHVSTLDSPLQEVWVSVRSDGLPDPADQLLNPTVIGDGTVINPWDGSTARKLDFILNVKLTQPNIVIHLGPGVFRTGGGGASLYPKWSPLSGWRIVGSGTFQTMMLLTVCGQTAVLPEFIGRKSLPRFIPVRRAGAVCRERGELNDR